MARQVKLILSFDHELSLGGSEDYARDLFDPTDRLLDLAKSLNVHIVLFTDILCGLRFKEWDLDNFYLPYTNQLKRALLENHDVQLHLHPHWMDSTYTDKTFNPSSSYGLGAFAQREAPNDIAGIITQGIKLLSDIASLANENYQCIAYRAGGYNLAPYTKEILSSLFAQGIRIDSSLAKGFKFSSKLSKVDFGHMPCVANWFIHPDGPLNKPAEGGLYEIPIATRPRNTLNNLPFLVKRVLHRKRAYQSGGKGLNDGGNTSAFQKMKRLFPNSSWMLSFDNYTDNVRDLEKILNSHIKAHKNDDEIICALISHPKSMGDHALSLMNDFVNLIKSKYTGQVSFSTYRDIYNEKRLSELCWNL